jgi:hypothetical protein
VFVTVRMFASRINGEDPAEVTFGFREARVVTHAPQVGSSDWSGTDGRWARLKAKACCNKASLTRKLLANQNHPHTSVAITMNLSFGKWAMVFGDSKMTTALLDRVTHHCHIVETGNES